MCVSARACDQYAKNDISNAFINSIAHRTEFNGFTCFHFFSSLYVYAAFSKKPTILKTETPNANNANRFRRRAHFFPLFHFLYLSARVCGVCVSVSSHSLANVLVLNCCYQHLYKYALSQFQTQHALA